MADSKVEKALYGPSTTEVALGALLGLLLGVVLACVYLVFKPVQQVKELPKELDKGVVYHVPGSTDTGRSRGWPAKHQTFLKGGSVIASEAELNAWAASLSGGAPAAKPGETAPPPGGDMISVSGLNFRMEGDRMHVAQRVLLNYFGLTKEVMAQVVGNFAREGDTFVFRPDIVYFGSCPVHAIPGAARATTGLLAGKQKVPDEFRAAWAKLTAITVEDSLLKATTLP